MWCNFLQFWEVSDTPRVPLYTVSIGYLNPICPFLDHHEWVICIQLTSHEFRRLPKSWRVRYLYGLLWWRSIDFVTAHLHIAGRMALALMLSQVATLLSLNWGWFFFRWNQTSFIFDRFILCANQYSIQVIWEMLLIFSYSCGFDIEYMMNEPFNDAWCILIFMLISGNIISCMCFSII